MKLSFRVKSDVAANRSYPAALTLQVNQMQARLKALGTSESVLDLAGVSKTDAGQVNARPRVAAKVPVSLYGYVSPGQDPSNPGSVGAPPLSGSAAELRAHSAGCSPSECIVNQDFRDNCLLQRRLATCAVTPHSSGASEDFGNNGVLPNAASELASGRHVLSMTSVEDENVCVSLPIHVWAVKSISVHAEKSVLRRVDGVPDSPVDMSRDGRVQVEDVDSDVIRIERSPEDTFQLSVWAGADWGSQRWRGCHGTQRRQHGGGHPLRSMAQQPSCRSPCASGGFSLGDSGR